MEFDEHEEQEDEIASRGGGEGVSAAATARKSVGGGGGGGGGSTATYRYRECLKNHAVGIGGHAVDGCGEFMAAGEDGTLESLKCAACNCHRNFHRKEPEGGGGGKFHHPHPASHQHPQFSAAYSFRSPHPSGYLHVTPVTRPLALPSTSREDEDMSNPSSSGGGGGGRSGGAGGSKKRHRTKFTQDQKEKMLAIAERLGWRIQKQDEALVQQFCAETNVKRHVLKVKGMEAQWKWEMSEKEQKREEGVGKIIGKRLPLFSCGCGRNMWALYLLNSINPRPDIT